MERDESKQIDRGPGGNGDQSLFGLREIRENRGVGFKEMVAATKVSPQMIEALEGTDFEKLPEPVYTRAFLQAYCRVLNIESEPLVERYNALCVGADSGEGKYKHLRIQRRVPSRRFLWLVPAAMVALLVALVSYYHWQARVTSPGTERVAPVADDQRVPVHRDAVPVMEGDVIGSPSAPVAGDAAGVEDPVEDPVEPGITETVDPRDTTGESPVALRGSGPDPKPPSAEKIIDKKTQPADRPAVVVVPTPPGPAAQESIDAEELLLEIRAAELTWIQIVRDGERREQLYLKAGERLTRRAEERFDIIIGNAGGTDVVFQGSSLGVLGRRGEVISLSLPRETGN